MPLKFYMDVHIPAAITHGLQRRGVDIMTSQEDGTRESTDQEILRRASELGRLLVTQDADFLQIVAECHVFDQPVFGVIYARQQAAGIGRLIEDLELLALYADPVRIFRLNFSGVHGRIRIQLQVAAPFLLGS